MAVLRDAGATFTATVPVVIVGAGACGLVTALAARESIDGIVVVERDPLPAGSTAMSSGMIPACGTRFQRDKGIDDTVDLMTADIMAKCHGEADQAIVETLCRLSGPTTEWLADEKGVELSLVEGFLYPGHSRLRMHAPPAKTGAALIGSLTRAVAEQGIDIATDAPVTDLFAGAGGAVRGIRVTRPDGTTEDIGCNALVLACNGFGGDPEMVRQHIPQLAGAEYYGHPGNRGDAVKWGQALGAGLRHMGAYQGHGSLAYPHRVLITWALMMEGGVQVNAEGERFANEHQGYSEQALAVLSQPGGVAWNIFDDRLLALGRTFEDFRQAESMGALRDASTVEGLAETMDVPLSALERTVAGCAEFATGLAEDPFGRDFTTKPPLQPPYHAIRVTGALFHTQGGLLIDTAARVVRSGGQPLPNLFAGGGAACGVSGSSVSGYLSGNGLLSAVMLGRLAGIGAASLATASISEA